MARTGSRRSGGAVLLAAAALLPAACGSSGEDDGPVPVAAPAGVSVEVLQYRSDQPIRRLELKVRNAGPDPITVTGARLRSSRFAAETAWIGEAKGERYTIRPGEALDLPAPVPAASCSATADAAGDRVRLHLVQPEDGGIGAATLPVADPYELLDRLRGDDCRRAEVFRIATIEVREPLRVEGTGRAARAFYDLAVTPTGAAGTVTLVSIAPTTLVSPPGGAPSWPLDLAVGAASGPLTVPVEIRPARCDPHAVAEDKLGTVLPITVRQGSTGTVGGDGVIEVPAPVATKGQVYDWVAQVCGNA